MDFSTQFNVSLNVDNDTQQKSFQSPPTGMVAFYIVLFLIAEFLGTFLLICMIIYEKYGMDPQKRTVSNQLLSNNCVMWIVHNLVVMPIFTVEQIFGPEGNFSINFTRCGLFFVFINYDFLQKLSKIIFFQNMGSN